MQNLQKHYSNPGFLHDLVRQYIPCRYINILLLIFSRCSISIPIHIWYISFLLLLRFLLPIRIFLLKVKI